VVTRQDERRIVQCKRWQSWPVGVNDVRGFAGTLMREALPGSGGIFVTLSEFTDQARTEADSVRMTLIDGRDLYDRIKTARRSEPCPTCGAPMMLDRSSVGWWLRCVVPGCRGKRDLSDNAGRAVELLTRAA
jgi:hypothetical protein